MELFCLIISLLWLKHSFASSELSENEVRHDFLLDKIHNNLNFDMKMRNNISQENFENYNNKKINNLPSINFPKWLNDIPKKSMIAKSRQRRRFVNFPRLSLVYVSIYEF